MTNTLDSDVGHLARTEVKDVTLAKDLNSNQTTIDSLPLQRRIEGSVAAAMLAPAVAMLVIAIGNFLAPVVGRLGLQVLFLENGISNLAAVVAIGSWLFTWVALYETWHNRMIPRPKLYTLMFAVIVTAAVLLIPAVYRLAEIAVMG